MTSLPASAMPWGQLEATRKRAESLSDQTLMPPSSGPMKSESSRKWKNSWPSGKPYSINCHRQVGETIQRLQQYDFVDRQAREEFEALVQALQQQAMQRLFESMKQRLQAMSAGDMQRLQQMLSISTSSWNSVMRAWTGDFQEFLERYRDMFPGQTPENLEEFLEQMAQNMEAMQSLLNSMSEEMRQELQGAHAGTLCRSALAAGLYGTHAAPPGVHANNTSLVIRWLSVVMSRCLCKKRCTWLNVCKAWNA